MNEELVGAALVRRAAETPEASALLFVDGPEWSWTELHRRVRDHAAGLQALGVARGDLLLSWMPNGPVATLNFLAAAWLGVVYVPVNIGLRGALLTHVLRLTGAHLMVAHGALLDRLAEIDRADLERVIVIGDERPALPGIALLDQAVLAGDGAELSPVETAPWDTQMVIFTSGTTGPSKGVLSSFRHARTAALGFRNIGPGDRNLTALPAHHVGGVYGILWAIYHGGSVVIAERFRTQDFWPLVGRYQITTTGLLGVMVDFMNALPPFENERRHGLKSVLVAPYTPSALRFAERYGVPAYTEFNMTELSVPTFGGPEPLPPGSCGRAQGEVELRLVDTHDIVVPADGVGELILRTHQSWQISHGYLNDPAATARAWRNGWFHTGDLFRRDADGNYFFVDRVKDAVRRRGENISSFEVEAAILAHPAVAQAAVVGVPADAGAEDEVMAVVKLASGQTLDPAVLVAFLSGQLAAYMVPRYVRFVDTFPLTPTQKIEKHRLRAEGVTSDCWDRDARGVRLSRDRLERRG